MFRSNWLGHEEWKSQGMPILSTSSKEAVKLYDAALSQFAGWYDDPILGGLTQTLTKLNQADSNFVLGNAFTLCMQLIGFTECYFTNSELKNSIDELQRNAEENKDKITVREYKHVQAAIKMSKLDWNGAAQIWEDILAVNPTDMHALKMAFYMYFFTGQKQAQFNSIDRVYSYYQKSSVVNSNLIDGIYAFTLEEIGSYFDAEKYARLGLMKNPCDGWTTHSLAHVFETQGRFSEGLNFMSDTSKLWTKSNLLACHNYWHLSLFNIATDNLDGAIYLLDNEILPRVRSSQTSFSITDASSLLYRLSLISSNTSLNINFNDKFNDVFSVTKQYLNKHVLPFNDVHYMMASLGSGNRLDASNLIETLQSSMYAEVHPNLTVVTTHLLKAMTYYQEENYGKATDILLTIKDDLIQIGGSDAQRDVFNQLLLVSSLKSSKLSHKTVFHNLMRERQCNRQNETFIYGRKNI